MIISIDESGSFNCNLGEFSLFSSIIIPTDNQHYQDIKDSYFKWESSIPTELFNSKGEIKGTELSENHFVDFVDQLFIKHDDLRFSYLIFNTVELQDSVVQKHKDIEVAMLDFSVKDFEKNNAPKKQTNYIKSIRNWISSKNLQQYLKILGLRMIINKALRYSMIYFLPNLRESEIINGSYLIDKDFINDQNIYWQGYFKRLLLEYTKSEPLPVVDTWDKDTHPFFKRFPIMDNNQLNLSYLFRDNMNFEDSDKYFEIRLADLCCVILFRYHNQDKYKNIFNKLKTKSLAGNGDGDYIMLRDFDFQSKLSEITDKYI